MANKEQFNELDSLLDREDIQMKLFQLISDRLLGKSKTGSLTSNNAGCESCQKKQDTIDTLKKELEGLVSRLDKEKRAAVLAQENCDQSQKQNKILSEKLDEQKNANKDLHKRLLAYRDNFEDDLRIHAVYHDLSDTTKNSLSGIFKDTSIQGLIACGIQDGNISNLWDYIKNEVIHGNNPDEDNLVMIFQMFFKRFSMSYPMYQLELSLVGQEFNNQKHIKHQSSLTSSGIIKKISLPGYTNTKTGKPVKQSVVVL